MRENNKIKVLHAIRQGLIGGGETHVLDLVRHMDRKRFEPVVLSFTDGPMIERLHEMNVPCHVIPSGRAFDVVKWNKVKSLIKSEKSDIVHAHGTRAASNLLWAARSAGVPIIYTIHGWSFHDDQKPIVKKFRILSEHFLTSKMNLNISVSASNQLSGKSFFPRFKSAIVNNGINLERFDPDKTFPDIRKSLKIPPQALLISFIARMTKQKAPLVLLKAFQKIIKQCPDAWLLMVGEGELREEAETMARQLQIDHRVIFENFRQDVPAILQTSDIYCLPSLWEGLSIGLLEAMAMRNAVVATKVDGSSEVIRHEENGLLVEAGSANELSESLIRLCHHNEIRKKLQLKARETVCNRYNVHNMAEHIAALYENFIQQEDHKVSVLNPLFV